MRRCFLAAAVGLVFACVGSGATAGRTGASPVVLSPGRLDFGRAMHVGAVRTLPVTVTNPTGYLTRLLSTSFAYSSPPLRTCTKGGRNCPLNVERTRPGSCPAADVLSPHQGCQIFVRFKPFAAGRFSARICTAVQGPIGAPRPPPTAPSHFCVSVTATVLPAPTAPKTVAKPRTSHPPAGTAARTPKPTPTPTPTPTAPTGTPKPTTPKPTSPTGTPSANPPCPVSRNYAPQSPPTPAAGSSLLFTPTTFDVGSIPLGTCVTAQVYAQTNQPSGIDVKAEGCVGLGCKDAAWWHSTRGGATLGCNGDPMDPLHWHLYPRPLGACYFLQRFWPRGVGQLGVSETDTCFDYTYNTDLTPKPVHRACVHLVGRAY